MLRFVEFDAIGQWDASETNGLILPEGSKLQLTVGDQVERRHDEALALVDTWHVGYRILHPEHDEWLHAFDEWLDVGTGRIVQNSLRSVVQRPAGPEHFTTFNSEARPPLMLASLFWGSDHSGMNTEIPLEAAVNLPGMPNTPGHLTTRLVKATHVSNDCQYTIRIKYDTGDYGPGELELEVIMTDGSPFPLEYRVTKSSYQGREAELRLVAERNPLENAALPCFSSGFGFLNGRPLEAAPQGHPVGRWSTETDLEEALQAASATQPSSTWLNQHPDAFLMDFRHAAAPESSDPLALCTRRDQWELSWQDGQQTYTVIVQKQRGDLLCEPFLITPMASEETGGKPLNQMLPVSSIQATYEAFYGRKPIEHIHCLLGHGFCTMGPHEATFHPRAGQSFFGEVLPGIIVSLVDGAIYQETSVSTVALGPIVNHPSL